MKVFKLNLFKIFLSMFKYIPLSIETDLVDNLEEFQDTFSLWSKVFLRLLGICKLFIWF